jgi:hypothetical protein
MERFVWICLAGAAGTGARYLIALCIHTASLVEPSSDLPVLIEVVEDEAHVDRLLPILDEMVTGGALVTVERVRVVKICGGTQGESISASMTQVEAHGGRELRDGVDPQGPGRSLASPEQRQLRARRNRARL